MYRVTEVIEFCYGHRLLNYQGKCAHLHGHNGRAEIVLAAQELDGQSMVADFSDIDRIVRSWIEKTIDHQMILNRKDPLVRVLQEHHEPVFLMDSDPTAEAIARVIFDYAASQGLPVEEIRLWETGSSVASYGPGGRRG
jgi:6-pyruvoyltetrahydropterin/6-carboxytetrahydropterin synthase